MISIECVRNITSVVLPSVIVSKKLKHVSIRYIATEPRELTVIAVITDEARGNVTGIRLTHEEDIIDIISKGNNLSLTALGKITKLYAPDMRVVGSTLDLGSRAAWIHHPMATSISRELNRHICETWDLFPRLIRERSNSAEAFSMRRGYRLPQLGALHAVAAHWSVKTNPAKVVLPTGTGKTDVLISSVLMHAIRRTLVVVPSDALRTQVSGKFESLSTLRELRLIDGTCRNPVVGIMTKAPQDVAGIEEFDTCHVVVATSSMLSMMKAPIAKVFISQFEAVFFDEAHHLAAPTWDRMLSFISARQRMLAVTATPFRNDGKKLPGETIYQFPLRMAQQLGYFKSIAVIEIDEPDDDTADKEIAKAAVNALHANEQEQGWKHVILARAKSIKHAKHLHSEIYAQQYPHLSPVVLHSRTPQKEKKQIIEALLRFEHRIVVCVDMLGEGFDFPALKIAAMHELHKSLPVTLQFIGRFTRTSENVGTPTLIINVAKATTPSAVSSLYEQDADWNELLPEFSARAIKSEHDVEAFSQSMELVKAADDKVFDLSLIRPKTSASFFKVRKFSPDKYRRGFDRDAEIHQVWRSEDESTLVVVSQQRSLPEWSTSKGATNSNWTLHIASYDQRSSLLYLHSSDGSHGIGQLAKALSGDSAELLSGERMFRAFSGLNRTILHNVGLYRKGNLRFQMLAGIDIGAHVSAATQAGSGKSNLFAVGYQDGGKVSVGVSFKGRAWAMSAGSIPDWINWCSNISRKIVDESIPTNGFFDYVLIPNEITSLPVTRVFACVLPEEMLLGEHTSSKRYVVDGIDSGYMDVDLATEYIETTGDSVVLSLQVADNPKTLLQMRWGNVFRVTRLSGPSVSVLQQGKSIGLESFFEENPPVLLLVDGSEIRGRFHFKSHVTHPYTFSRESIHATDWGITPITAESKWKNGIKRSMSVQGHMIELCMADPALSFVIDDDDAQEAADIIAIQVDEPNAELIVYFYHCKYSGQRTPGARIDDLYEVCGQAVKSTRLVHRAESLFEHIAKREGRLGGRPTRFEKGTLPELKAVQRQLNRYRVRTQIAIVQPGLSTAGLTPELSSILGAADNFVFEFTGRHLNVYGSA